MQIAYLDAGTGSILASALVGGVAAAGVAARSVRARISGTFRKNKDEAASAPTADEESVSVDAAD